MKNSIREINSKGFANGWHAETLAAEAKRNGETMADCFKRKIADSVAFNVPAECTKVNKDYTFYKFKDQSTIRITNFN